MSDKLFNTAEAAKYLRVSQASVRRWSDGGLLQAQRVGRRRERRFTERDLRAFMEPAAVAQHVSVRSDIVVGGVPAPLHKHLATFYNSDEGRLRLTLPFFRDGLRLGQPCFLAASDLVLDAYGRALRTEGIEMEAAVRAGQLVVVDGPGSTVDLALQFWERALSNALESRPALMRIVGEMVSERNVFSTELEMMRYEVAFNTIAKRFPTVTLCQYDVRAFSGEAIYQALRAHPDLYDLRVGSFLN
jgi:excisionase family DNA binding protein